MIIARKKYMYWDSFSKKFRYALKCRGKSFPYSTHLKLFHEVSKAPWCLCLCYMSCRLKPSLIVQGDSLKWIIKFLLKHTTFYKSGNLLDLTELVNFIFLSSADNLCELFGPRSALTECWSWSGFYWSWSGFKAYYTLALMVFMKKKSKRLIL